jgi:hypothetical protein
MSKIGGLSRELCCPRISARFFREKVIPEKGIDFSEITMIILLTDEQSVLSEKLYYLELAEEEFSLRLYSYLYRTSTISQTAKQEKEGNVI